MPMARSEVERLLAEQLPADQRGRVAYAAARIARVEGDWEAANELTRLAHGAPIADEERREETAGRAADMARAASARAQESARQSIARLRGRSSWGRVPTARLRSIVEIAARAGLSEEVDGAVEALSKRSNLNPGLAFDVAVLAAGLADDALLVDLLAHIKDNPRYRVSGRYHYARALERAGRYVEAEVEFLRVAQLDNSETRWYAMLSEQRLWAVREAMLCRCGPEEMRELGRAQADDEADDEADDDDAPLVLAALSSLPDASRRLRSHHEGTRSDNRPIVPPVEPDLDALADRLLPIVEAHGEAYPWLGRAHQLLRLGEPSAASDELHEVYLAYRDAAGRGLRRTGIEAVYRGTERPRVFVDWTTKRQRKQLDRQSKLTLADITSALGDEGTAVGFSGWSRVAARPRAYEPLVREIARRHSLDPNLLLAVMRVESVYQRRIVSYAGAVGLMQIMPRTGRLIADSVGRDDFTTADLLDPETNLDFAAWYLSSLIERFDGRLPLAIASYNGGPHNVRRWMRDHHEHMALDAFLEEIPFDQTHRYVRRVLTHYAAYRQQENLPMERLTLSLPEPQPDAIAF
jgi:soluble lytic murein transglycosylase